MHIRDAADVAFRSEVAGYLLGSRATGRRDLCVFGVQVLLSNNQKSPREWRAERIVERYLSWDGEPEKTTRGGRTFGGRTFGG